MGLEKYPTLFNNALLHLYDRDPPNIIFHSIL